MSVSFEYYPGGKKKALTMSYDDGHHADRRLVELFNQHGIKATFNLISGWFDTGDQVKADEIKDLYQGHEVAAHTVNHLYLPSVPSETVVDEIYENRKTLEQLVGYPVKGFVPPFGATNERILSVLPALGIEYCRKGGSNGLYIPPVNFLEWQPTLHHRQNLLDKWREFQNDPLWVPMPILSVYGHSHDFIRENNWEIIEQFCRMAGFDGTIWYATNLEIVDYLKALRGLRFTADRKTVCNLSAISVWIDVDGEAVEVKGGQSVSF